LIEVDECRALVLAPFECTLNIPEIILEFFNAFGVAHAVGLALCLVATVRTSTIQNKLAHSSLALLAHPFVFLIQWSLAFLAFIVECRTWTVRANVVAFAASLATTFWLRVATLLTAITRFLWQQAPQTNIVFSSDLLEFLDTLPQPLQFIICLAFGHCREKVTTEIMLWLSTLDTESHNQHQVTTT
jgi:hypothetical protein